MKQWLFRHELTSTSAVFGRKKDISVIFKGGQAATDGSTIYLPSVPDSIELDKEQQRIMRGYVDHEAGHIRHSDMPLLIKKYKKWAQNKKEGLKVLHNSIEDMWLERRVMEEYPGAEKNLHTLTEHIDKMQHASISPSFYTKTNADSVGLGIRTAGRKDYAGPTNRTLWGALPENIQKWSEKIIEETHKCQCTTDTIRLAKAVYKLLEQDPEMSGDPEDFDVSIGDSVGDGGDGEPTEGQKSATGGEYVEGKDVIEGEIPGGIGAPKGDYKGEWRYYTSEYDEEISVDNPKNYGGFKGESTHEYHKIKAAIASDVATIKTKLRRGLLSLQRRDWEYGRQQGRLDSKRLVAAATGSSTVYKQRTDREDMDTAVMLLIDQSGSMGGSKVQVARECAIALAEALEGTGVAYSIAGFSTGGSDYDYSDEGPYHKVEGNLMFNHKPFNKSLRQSWSSLASIEAYGNNIDRDAILWSLFKLKQREERRKVLVVLSDGEPINTTINVGQEELERHTKEAVKQCVNSGVEVVGIGIQSSAVKRFYKDSIVVSSLSDFSTIYFNKFMKILLKGQKQ